MTLLIEDTEVKRLLTMEKCIDAMEEAYKEYASGIAVNRPRLRYRVPSPGKPKQYFTNIIAGAVPKYGTAAVRINSLIRREVVIGGFKRSDTEQPGKRSWGLVMLYSLETGELLAIIHDFTISGIRVGATSAVGVKHLARANSEVLGLIGTGKQARTHLEGIAQVCPIKKVKVYSPSEEHRKEFCNVMGKTLGMDIQPENNAKAVVKNADIVCCATNSYDPVCLGEWLSKGQLVITIGNTDVTVHRVEVDETTLVLCDFIVVSDKESVFANKQTELMDPIEKGLFTWDKVRQLGDILIGKCKGRSSPEELIYYKNNTGMGIQFAASAAIVYEEARKSGVGRELPTEWFGTDLSDWYEKGYYPTF